jgi:hypothetical protein
MKKTIITSMAFVILATGVFLYSCKKELGTQPQTLRNEIANCTSNTNRGVASPYNVFNVSVINNRLAFANIEDYNKVVDNPTDATRQSFLYCINKFVFTSLQEKYPTFSDTATTQIYDDYFRQIINTDMAVQIGAHIFHINAAKGNVYVLPVIFESQYTQLIAEDRSNPNITTYSTEDEVLNIIQNQSLATRCKETGVRSYPLTTGNIGVDSDRKISLKGDLAFRRFGIYFHLFAEGFVYDLSKKIMTNIKLKIEVDNNSWYYHARCGRTVGPYTPGPFTGDGHYKYNSYSGSKSLNKIFVRTRYTAIVPPNTQLPNGYEVVSPWLEIRANY